MVRQMGQRLVWWRSMRAQVEHMHRWRHGMTVVSRGSLMQMTHSFELSSDAEPITCRGGTKREPGQFRGSHTK